MSLDELRIRARYVRRLPAFFAQTLSAEQCWQDVERDLDRRTDHLVALLEHAVFARPASPYLRLFRHAGIEREEALRLVRSQGVEPALEQFRSAGVYVTLEELRGRRPIERSGLSFEADWRDFDNVGMRAGYSERTGGSRGRARSVVVDLGHIRRQVVYRSLFLDLWDARRRPLALWRTVPPGLAGINFAIALAKLGLPLDRWFSPTRLVPGRHSLREYAFAAYAIAASRRSPAPIPWPVHVPVEQARRVAAWLAQTRQERRPALVVTTGSGAVRICLAALEAGHDISGTLFRAGGEPITEAKAAAVAAAGCRAIPNYAITEAGQVGLACSRPDGPDDVHLLADGLALIPSELPSGPPGVEAQLLTTLLPQAPKLLLNAETGDFGELEQRNCGCPLAELGLSLHLRRIRSYEKLTSEGMSFQGAQVLTLVEETLPGRFGGGPADYQLVEREVEGLPRVEVVVSPRVGALDERELLSLVLRELESGPSYRRMMASVWRGGETLQVVRREPYATATGKILPLHVSERS